MMDSTDFFGLMISIHDDHFVQTARHLAFLKVGKLMGSHRGPRVPAFEPSIKDLPILAAGKCQGQCKV